MQDGSFQYCPTTEATPLSMSYFGKANVDHLQKELHDRVYEQSCGKFDIGRQDDRQLFIIMRSIFMTYARHVVDKEREEICELNERVLHYAVPNVLGAINEMQRSIVDLDNPGLRPFDQLGAQTRDYKTLQPRNFF